jgi:hypothetical protein
MKEGHLKVLMMEVLMMPDLVREVRSVVEMGLVVPPGSF